ncbi:daunorubicin resistance ABC transporter ATPase subunit [Halorhabdus utahensis DSM 12940]|uniref:Daunorubicin resistance ABC transporter ATPase subunit n=1 Tax=Halorhabdus utahensis (strain DSM 12940 / JCM 11049 / AX-2) TaxID=519442 RepID=C7NNB9_HALUD|nr:daunorubicin resistance ABC transporter ATPase subunit [Halorhabdus utahensis DSM 12940]
MAHQSVAADETDIDGTDTDGTDTDGIDTDRTTGGHVTDSERSIEMDALSLTYADGTHAVEDVTLSVPQGEFFGFLGPNGAGKTTTIKVLATLLEPTSGTVEVNGFDVVRDRTAVRASIGYMAQETSIDTELTARENLMFACDAYGVPRDDRARRIADLLNLVDLADVADTPAGNFSGGMKKRLDAATALVHDPDLVFLDEPTTGLDPQARNRLWEYFRRINAGGTTVFLTTQYLEEADHLCDRLAVIRDGRIVADGAPDELKRRVGGDILELEVGGDRAESAGEPVDAAADIVRETAAVEPSATVETTDDAIRITARDAGDLGPDVLLALRDADVPVTGFDVTEPTLDDVFLAIAGDSADGLDGTTETVDAAATEEASGEDAAATEQTSGDTETGRTAEDDNAVQGTEVEA